LKSSQLTINSPASRLSGACYWIARVNSPDAAFWEIEFPRLTTFPIATLRRHRIRQCCKAVGRGTFLAKGAVFTAGFGLLRGMNMEMSETQGNDDSSANPNFPRFWDTALWVRDIDRTAKRFQELGCDSRRLS
jgi:hypothetical protein